MSAAPAFRPPHEERGKPINEYRRREVMLRNAAIKEYHNALTAIGAPNSCVKSLASDPLVWLTSGWRTKAMQWLIDGRGRREVILRNAAGQFAACRTPGQLVSAPDEYYGDGCAVFYRFSKTYIAIRPGAGA